MTKRYIRHASELVTCKGQAPKRGKEMSDIGLIEDGGVLIHDDKIFAVGTTEELDKMINPGMNMKLQWPREKPYSPVR